MSVEIGANDRQLKFRRPFQRNSQAYAIHILGCIIWGIFDYRASNTIIDTDSSMLITVLLTYEQIDIVMGQL